MRGPSRDDARRFLGRLWGNRGQLFDKTQGIITEVVREAGAGLSDSISYPLFGKRALGNLMTQERGLRAEYQALVIAQPDKWRRLDSLSIGGLLLTDVLSGAETPAVIEGAFQAAYPRLAAGESFSEAANSMNAEQLPGLLAGVKGKLFEIQYAEKLNAELLPDGYVASLAASATQPGWDIAVTGPDEALATVLQVKATDSAIYVRRALEQHPEIDVATTDEVYSQLLLSGGAEGLVHSGIANADLEQAVASAALAGHELDFTPPLLGLALIGLTALAFESGSLGDKATSVARRCGQAYPAWMVGKMVAMVGGPLWWLSIPAGIGARHIASEGRLRRQAYVEIRRRMRTHEAVLSRFRPQARRPRTTF